MIMKAFITSTPSGIKTWVEKKWIELTQSKPDKQYARDLQAFQAGYRWASEEYKRHKMVELIHKHIHGSEDHFDKGVRKWLADNNLPLDGEL